MHSGSVRAHAPARRVDALTLPVLTRKPRAPVHRICRTPHVVTCRYLRRCPHTRHWCNVPVTPEQVAPVCQAPVASQDLGLCLIVVVGTRRHIPRCQAHNARCTRSRSAQSRSIQMGTSGCSANARQRHTSGCRRSSATHRVTSRMAVLRLLHPPNRHARAARKPAMTEAPPTAPEPATTETPPAPPESAVAVAPPAPLASSESASEVRADTPRRHGGAPAHGPILPCHPTAPLNRRRRPRLTWLRLGLLLPMMTRTPPKSRQLRALS